MNETADRQNAGMCRGLSEDGFSHQLRSSQNEMNSIFGRNLNPMAEATLGSVFRDVSIPEATNYRTVACEKGSDRMVFLVFIYSVSG